MNEIKLLQFLTTDDCKYSRKTAMGVVRDYTKNNLPKAISVKALDILGRKPMSYYDFKQMRDSDKCIWEHAIPVNELVSTMFTNATLIETTLKNAPICIVTAEEDARLTENGFRETRDNWRNAYHECQIKLVEVDKEDELLFYKSFYEMNYKPHYNDNNPAKHFIDECSVVEFTDDKECMVPQGVLFDMYLAYNKLTNTKTVNKPTFKKYLDDFIPAGDGNIKANGKKRMFHVTSTKAYQGIKFVKAEFETDADKRAFESLEAKFESSIVKNIFDDIFYI